MDTPQGEKAQEVIVPAPPIAAVSAPASAPAQQPKFASFPQLAKQTLGDLRDAPLEAVGSVILPFLLYSLAMMPISSTQLQPLYALAPAPLGLILFVLAYALLILASSANVLQARSGWKLPVSEAYALARTKFWPMAWLMVLGILTMFGSEIPLIIPALFTSVWFMLASPALILDGVKGVHAISYGRELSRGVWGKILWRFFAPGVFIALFFILLSMLGLISTKNPQGFFLVLSVAYSGIFVFFNAYIANLYLSLKAHKGITPDVAKDKNRNLIIGLASWGGVAVILLAGFALWASVKAPMPLPQVEMSEMAESTTV